MKKTVLITGASRGIGREAAKLFSSEGWQVAINYKNSGRQARELAASLIASGGTAALFQADVSIPAQVETMVSEIHRLFGGIDVLVNNAGIAKEKLFTDISENEWDEMFSVNVKSVFNCCKCVLPAMIQKKNGKIINISSIWGITGASCEVHYSAAKAAVIGMTRALAKELGPSNIQVNCVAPGIIDTDMTSNLDKAALEELKRQTPLGVLGTPAGIANVLFFLASDKSDFITGQVISPNGGFVI